MFGAYFTLIPTLRATDPDGFYNFMRMTVSTFDRLLELVGPCLQKRSKRKFVCPGEMLAITLRYMSVLFKFSIFLVFILVILVLILNLELQIFGFW